MKATWLLSITGLLCAGAIQSHAAVIPCTTGSLSSYMALGSAGCTIDSDYTFKDFNYLVSASVFANNITASNITVTPTSGPGGPTLTFSANWSASGVLASTYAGVLRFTGTASGLAFSPFDSQQLGVAGSASGLSTATVSETNCVGGLLQSTGVACLTGGITESLAAQITGTATSANANVAFSPASLVDVYKTISLVGAANGSASLSSFSQTFGVEATPTPEPATFGLIGAGCFSFALLRRRKRQA